MMQNPQAMAQLQQMNHGCRENEPFAYPDQMKPMLQLRMGSGGMGGMGGFGR